VKMQVLFAQSKEYFIVDPRLGLQRHDSTHHPSLPQTPPSSQLRGTGDISAWEATSHDLNGRFRVAQDVAKTKYRRIEPPQHTAELRPWQRLCKYHEHLEGVDFDLIASVTV
jgi:hypothetical protein